MTQMTTPELLAKTVRDERRRQRLRQEDLALVASVAVRSIHRIENAEETVRLDSLLRVLSALGLELRVDRRGPA